MKCCYIVYLIRIFGPRRRLLNAIKQFTFIKTSLLMDKPDELTTTNPNVASDGDRSNKLVNHDVCLLVYLVLICVYVLCNCRL